MLDVVVRVHVPDCAHRKRKDGGKGHVTMKPSTYLWQEKASPPRWRIQSPLDDEEDLWITSNFILLSVIVVLMGSLNITLGT